MARMNQVYLLGVVCSEVDFRILPKTGVAQAKYQLAIKREKHNGMDYPYVVTYGKQAELDAQHVRRGSQLLVKGKLQTRNFDQTITCPHCKGDHVKPSTTYEVVGEVISYLYNCNFEQAEIDAEHEEMRKMAEGMKRNE